jgi:hypothetical protein
MTQQPDLVEVVCVRCGTVCTAYLHQTSDHRPESWRGEEGDAPVGVCPECGARLSEDEEVAFDVLGAHPAR